MRSFACVLLLAAAWRSEAVRTAVCCWPACSTAGWLLTRGVEVQVCAICCGVPVKPLRHQPARAVLRAET